MEGLLPDNQKVNLPRSISMEIERLSRRLCIQTRKLKPGDPYFTTSETARSFQVSGTTANRALQLLSQRRVLVRRQRAGTFIAEPESNGSTQTLQRVHLVVHIDRDQSQIGSLLFQELQRQKCQRMLIVFRDQITSGDHVLLDAVQREMNQAGFGLDQLTVRC